MISAKEAREKTSPCCGKVKEELREIEARIRVAMYNGEYGINYTKLLHSQTQAELIRLGYKLDESAWQRSGRRGTYWINISWKEGD